MLALMKDPLPLVLKLIAPVFVLVGLLHLVFGLQADVMLGAVLPDAVLSDPVLDSQNRFYGVAFTAYGFLMYLCATDLARYATVLRVLLAVFFAAGLARLVSIALYGLPTVLVNILLLLELLLPPLLAWWLAKTLRDQ